MRTDAGSKRLRLGSSNLHVFDGISRGLDFGEHLCPLEKNVQDGGERERERERARARPRWRISAAACSHVAWNPAFSLASPSLSTHRPSLSPRCNFTIYILYSEIVEAPCPRAVYPLAEKKVSCFRGENYREKNTCTFLFSVHGSAAALLRGRCFLSGREERERARARLVRLALALRFVRARCRRAPEMHTVPFYMYTPLRPAQPAGHTLSRISSLVESCAQR